MALVLLALGSDRASASEPSTSKGISRAVILVGLPGDPEHKVRFARTVQIWRGWLTGPLGFKPGEVRVLGDPLEKDGNGRGKATREAIAREVAALKHVVSADDRLWVFWLGHANPEGTHAVLHLPGPDLTDDEFGALFRGIEAREQVFWMTSSGSGWLVQSLSRPGRIVLAATERDQEFNETEFPEALATIAGRPPARLDADKDGKVSVLELFRAVSAEVDARFAADQRVPTEHAQIDDDGDGVGTERSSAATAPHGPTATGDGALAGRTWVFQDVIAGNEPASSGSR